MNSLWLAYAYDAQGNMLTKVVWDDASRAAAVAKLDESRTYNRLNQLTKNIIVDNGVSTTWDFTYDTAGNMISKTDGTDTYTYEWSYDDRLTAVKLNGTAQASYEYDSMGRMLKRTVGTNLTTFKWDGWNLIKEQSGGLETLYIAPEGEIMAVHQGTNTYQLHGDQVGSVHTITNSSGAVVGEQALDPWGMRLQATGISLPCSGFVGKFGIREDSATGLIYMRNRWYDPQLQRFVSADPISIAGGLNLYSYAEADPVNNTDLTGLRPELLPSHIGDLNHAMTMSQQADPCNPFQLLGISAMIASGIIVAGASLIAAESLATAVSAHSAGDIATAYNAYIRSTIAGVTAVEEATGYMGPSLSGAAHGLIRSTREQAKVLNKNVQKLHDLGLYDGKRMTVNDALDTAEDYLGTGYIEKTPSGRFTSHHGTRQVRMTEADLRAAPNNHAGEPHLNFEALAPDPKKNGRLGIIENLHIYFTDE